MERSMKGGALPLIDRFNSYVTAFNKLNNVRVPVQTGGWDTGTTDSDVYFYFTVINNVSNEYLVTLATFFVGDTATTVPSKYVPAIISGVDNSGATVTFTYQSSYSGEQTFNSKIDGVNTQKITVRKSCYSMSVTTATNIRLRCNMVLDTSSGTTSPPTGTVVDPATISEYAGFNIYNHREDADYATAYVNEIKHADYNKVNLASQDNFSIGVMAYSVTDSGEFGFADRGWVGFNRDNNLFDFASIFAINGRPNSGTVFGDPILKHGSTIQGVLSFDVIGYAAKVSGFFADLFSNVSIDQSELSGRQATVPGETGSSAYDMRAYLTTVRTPDGGDRNITHIHIRPLLDELFVPKGAGAAYPHWEDYKFTTLYSGYYNKFILEAPFSSGFIIPGYMALDPFKRSLAVFSYADDNSPRHLLSLGNDVIANLTFYYYRRATTGGWSGEGGD